MPLLQNRSRFDPEQLARLNRSHLPKHIAIIPDGNRRWAKKHFLNSQQGHQEGADILMEIVKAAQELEIRHLTLYSFSTENWQRSPEEVFAFLLLIANYLIEQREEMAQTGIKLETIGDLNPLPSFLKEAIRETKEATKSCDKIDLILALNYGSRNELCRAVRALVEDCDNKRLNKEEINEETLSRYLDTHPWSDPDLLIRTSGELRLSNFLLWQISYAEMHISPTLWPDFSPKHLLDALLDFQGRERRRGGA